MFYMGLDLGQRRDHSAIAVLQKSSESTTAALLLRHVERVTLGTPYPQVVARVRDIARSPDLAGRCSLAVDATGVGAPVVEMLRAAQVGCEISAVTITSGEREHSASGPGGLLWSVPKQDLLTGVQVLLERGELRIARRMRDAGPLVKELLDMRMCATQNGRMKMGADGYGEHDDLVIALALACWRAKKKQLSFGSRRLPGI